MSIDDNGYDIEAATGMSKHDFLSHCQTPIAEDGDNWIDIICKEDVFAYLRMPGGIPAMPICMAHLVDLIVDGWTYEDGVEIMASLMESLNPWDVEEREQ